MDIFNLHLTENPETYTLTVNTSQVETTVIQEDPTSYKLAFVSSNANFTVDILDSKTPYALSISPVVTTISSSIGGEVSQSFRLQVSEAIFIQPVPIEGRTFTYDSSNRIDEIRAYLDTTKQELFQKINIVRIGNTIASIEYRNSESIITKTRLLQYNANGLLVGETS